MSNISSSRAAHPAGEDSCDEVDKYGNIVVEPSDNEIIDRLKKPSIGGTVQVKVDLIRRTFLHRDQLSKMAQLYTPDNAAELEQCLKKDKFPKKPAAGFVAKLLFSINRSLHALKGVVDGSLTRLTRTDSKFVTDILEPLLVEYSDFVKLATADINEERLDSARKAIVKLTDVELRRRFLVDADRKMTH